jgi:predicted ATPase/DNA-binding SARP family transcriptional activator
MDPACRIEMLGWLRVLQGDRVVSRFHTRMTGGLLAYLAYYQQRSHSRGALVELFWPEREPLSGRRSLRRALTWLRRQLEPPGVPPGAIILADRAAVQLNPDACTTDVALFEAALQAADQAAADAEKVRHLSEAVELYRGEFLPGYFEEWVLQERQYLAEEFCLTLEQLTALLEEQGDYSRALRWARRLVVADPLREEGHFRLIRLLVAVGQPAAALRQYEELERLLELALMAEPSAEIRAFVEGIGRRATLVAGGAGISPVRPARLGSAAERPLASNLPAPIAGFFGRHHEMAALLRLLLGEKNGPRAARLVTLTGAGGIGKTRLALVVAHRMCEGWRRAVCWVPLIDLAPSAATDEDSAATCRRIAEKILAGLGVPRAPTTDPLEQAVAVLSRQPTVLLLDNLEHLLPAAASLVRTLLERVEHLTVMATSRRQLGLVGERLFPVPPLPVPVVSSRAAIARGSGAGEQARASDIRQLQANPSLRLFVDRAQAVKPDFQLTERNATVLAELSRQLEGLPLAIELAAARAASLTPEQIVERLAARFELLARPEWQGDPKQRSLRAALDWSHQLLTPELQRFFARLSVFRGGWTLAAAQAVCQEPRALECLDSLRENSLILAEEDGPVMRYRLLETLREYGAEKLHEAGESETTRGGHLEHFTQVAEAVEPEVRGRERARAGSTGAGT